MSSDTTYKNLVRSYPGSKDVWQVICGGDGYYRAMPATYKPVKRKPHPNLHDGWLINKNEVLVCSGLTYGEACAEASRLHEIFKVHSC